MLQQRYETAGVALLLSLWKKSHLMQCCAKMSGLALGSLVLVAALAEHCNLVSNMLVSNLGSVPC